MDGRAGRLTTQLDANSASTSSGGNVAAKDCGTGPI
jgi:hypothetical protein